MSAAHCIQGYSLCCINDLSPNMTCMSNHSVYNLGMLTHPKLIGARQQARLHGIALKERKPCSLRLRASTRSVHQTGLQTQPSLQVSCLTHQARRGMMTVLTIGSVWNVNLHWVVVWVIGNVDAGLPWSVQGVANEVCSMVPGCSRLPQPVRFRPCTTAHVIQLAVQTDTPT